LELSADTERIESTDKNDCVEDVRVFNHLIGIIHVDNKRIAEINKELKYTADEFMRLHVDDTKVCYS
jgi:hypothetical protein